MAVPAGREARTLWTRAANRTMCDAMARGYFITLEGGEGAGKSTQAALLSERLKQTGHSVVQTREPGGTPGAEKIRSLLVEGDTDRWSATTETLLMYAARRDHIERVIAPALARGAVVVCDRYADSTRAYQGAAGDAPKDLIDGLEAAVLGDARPDLTLVFDLPVEIGLARTVARAGGERRFEAKDPGFHARLRSAFLDIAQSEPKRCDVIDASADAETVERAVWACVARRLARP